MAEDEVVALEGRDRLARQTVAVEPLAARARSPARAVQIHHSQEVRIQGQILIIAENPGSEYQKLSQLWSIPLDAVGVGVAEGGILRAGLDGGAGEAVAVEPAPSVALAPSQKDTGRSFCFGHISLFLLFPLSCVERQLGYRVTQKVSELG